MDEVRPPRRDAVTATMGEQYTAFLKAHSRQRSVMPGVDDDSIWTLAEEAYQLGYYSGWRDRQKASQQRGDSDGADG